MELEIYQILRKCTRGFLSINNVHCNNLDAAQSHYLQEKAKISNESHNEEIALNNRIKELQDKISQRKKEIAKYFVESINIAWSPIKSDELTVNGNQSIEQNFENSLHQAEKRIGILNHSITQYNDYLKAKVIKSRGRRTRLVWMSIAVISLLYITVKIFGGKDNNIDTQATLQAIVQSTQQALMASTIPPLNENPLSTTVLSNIEWQNSNIDIITGDIVTISAQGTWNHGITDPANELYDANGVNVKFSNAIMPSSVNVGALIGRIGDCESFLIGTTLSFTATCTGEFYMAMNDELGQFGNNVGELVVQVIVQNTQQAVAGNIQREPVITTAFTDIYESPTATQVNPTSTPIVIESLDPSVSIKIYDISSRSTTGQGTIRIQFLSGGKPLRDVGISINKAAQDIANQWTLVEGLKEGEGEVTNKTDDNGYIEGTLNPGDYGIWNDDISAVWNQLEGTWGVTAFHYYYKDPIQTILFPIQAGKQTDIVVSLTKLEIGAIDKDGNAVKGELVYIYCQGTDVAGNKIANDCKTGMNVTKIDNMGLASFNVGAGTYVIYIDYGWDGYTFYDISVPPGETIQKIFNLSP